MSPLQLLIKSLEVTPTKERQFTGQASTSDVHVYGGLILAQAMDAARQCCPDSYTVQSLHGHFLRPGALKQDIDIRVEDLKDGRRFKVFNVYCQQQGKTIFFATITFHMAEDGFEHTQEAPNITLPSTDNSCRFTDRSTPLANDQPNQDSALEIRINDAHQFDRQQSTDQVTWLKTTPAETEQGTLTDWQQTLLLAYCSDWNMPKVAIRSHVVKNQKYLKIASLDHSIWFYQQANLENWTAYSQDSPAAQGGRGHTRGLMYSESGELLASVSQECFMVEGKAPE